MQIAHCVPAYGRNSTVDVPCKHMIPFHKDNMFMPKCFFFIEMMRSGLLEVSWDIGTIKWQNVRKLKKTSIEFQALSCYKNDSKVELVQQII